jgi:arylsulfatase A-like enzyme
MMNKITTSILCLSLLSTLSFAASKVNDSESLQQPNVILILADDQGWGSTSVPMHAGIKNSASDFIETPHLEKLASKAVVFSNGYASHPNCSPTRASIQTGKSPALLKMTDIIGRNSGAFYQGNKLNPPKHINGLPYDEVTIAELIKANHPDYSTAHFGKWHLGHGGPEKHGFDESDGSTKNAEGDTKSDTNPKDIYGVTDRSIAWMQEQVAKEKPFFIQISHYATHLAIEAKKQTIAKVNKRLAGERHQSVEFAAMAENLDEGVGMILNEVDKLNISDNTYIIYLADNGTFPTEDTSNINGPLHGWKASVWEGGIRVPFMISGPGITPKYSITNVVSHDLYPTIAQWLNIKDIPADIEGGSLVEELKGGNNNVVKRKDDYLVFHFPHYQLNKGTQPASAIIQGDFKLIKLYEEQSYLLFNLKNDIAETKNLAADFPEKLEQLKANLASYLASIGDVMPTINSNYLAEKDPGTKYFSIKERIILESYFIVK